MERSETKMALLRICRWRRFTLPVTSPHFGVLARNRRNFRTNTEQQEQIKQNGTFIAQ